MKATTLGFNSDYAEEAPTFDEVSQLSGEVLLEFGAPWCGHCQAARPALEAVLKDFSALPHIKVYDGKGKRLGRVFKVKLWPTLILLRDGQEVKRLVRPVGLDEVRQLLSF